MFDRKVRLGRLRESGFDFNMLTAEWNNKYNELIAFREEQGNSRVMQKNLSLSKWSYRQRSKREEGTLTTEQIAGGSTKPHNGKKCTNKLQSTTSMNMVIFELVKMIIWIYMIG